MFDNYIFDLYGTLIDINTDEEDIAVWEKIAEEYRKKGACYSASDLRARYSLLCKKEKDAVKKLRPDYEYTDIKIENVFEGLFNAKGVSVTSEYISGLCRRFRQITTKYIKLYDGVDDLLLSLKSRGKKVYLLSNAQRAFTVWELEKFDLIKYFDDIFISSDFLCAKPDIHYYNTLIKKHKLVKDRSVMIGNDSVSDIEGSRKAGLHSLYIHQSISPDIKGELQSDFAVMDGDVRKIKKLILK